MKHHSSRVAGLVLAMCHCLGLDRRTTDGVVLSAYVHDVGKWAMPSSALCKSGALDPDEWRQVRAHTKLGAEMLASAGLHEAAEVALRHHEAWDGSGYPDGVKGESIPFAARVVAVCDVYSALRENRPYRVGLAHDEAMKIITEGDPQGRTRPEMFDPRLLFLFVEQHREMAKLFEDVGRIRHLARPTPISHARAPLLASLKPVAVDV